MPTPSSFEPEFGVDVRREAGRLHVSPRGELDLATAPLLERALREDGDLSEVTLDLRGLQFIDTSGLRLVLAEHRRLEAIGAELRLVRGPRAVQRVFELAGLAERLPFVDGGDA